MQESPLTKKMLVGSCIFATTMVLYLYLQSFFQSQTKIVFCDVGQGDATYIRIINKFDVLIDAGPNNAVLSCLGKYMPFYDHELDLAILSHPDFDHYFGFLSVLKRYKVRLFFMPPLKHDTTTFKQLINELDLTHTQIYFPVAGNTVTLGPGKFIFYWPMRDFLEKHINYPFTASSNSSLDVRLGNTTLPTNEFSSVFLFEENNYRLLSTGDATSDILRIIGPHLPISHDHHLNLLKAPHHGSKTGLTYEFMRLADPTLSVISVGSKNRYHLPSQEVLDLFKALKKSYVRTDEKGDVVFLIN